MVHKAFAIASVSHLWALHQSSASCSQPWLLPRVSHRVVQDSSVAASERSRRRRSRREETAFLIFVHTAALRHLRSETWRMIKKVFPNTTWVMSSVLGMLFGIFQPFVSAFGALYSTTTARVVSRTVPAGAAGAVTRTAQTQQSVLSRGRLCSKREIIKCSIIRIIRLIVSDDFCRFLGSRVFEQDGTTSERSRRSRRHCNEKAHFNTLILHTICKLTSYLTSTFRCMLCSWETSCHSHKKYFSIYSLSLVSWNLPSSYWICQGAVEEMRWEFLFLCISIEDLPYLWGKPTFQLEWHPRMMPAKLLLNTHVGGGAGVRKRTNTKHIRNISKHVRKRMTNQWRNLWQNISCEFLWTPLNSSELLWTCPDQKHLGLTVLGFVW